MLLAAGGCELSTTTHVKTAWKKLLPILSSRHLSFKILCRVYSSCVRSAMLHVSETWPLTKPNLQRLQHSVSIFVTLAKSFNDINLYHYLGLSSRRYIGNIFLIFSPRKQGLTFYANCLYISICRLMKILPRMLSVKLPDAHSWRIKRHLTYQHQIQTKIRILLQKLAHTSNAAIKTPRNKTTPLLRAALSKMVYSLLFFIKY